MLVGEALFKPLIETRHYLHWLTPAFCAVLVLVAGRWLAMSKTVKGEVINLVDETVAGKLDNKS